MPRQSRIDYPGSLHHIIVRGVGGEPIFIDDVDRADFVSHLCEILSVSETHCYAWSLIPNHFHLLLATGIIPVSKVMQSLLTGYAIRFNRRHKRSGHLYQNRYKSILCERDAYFQELIRYIHLNPLRAGLVEDLKSLDKYPWCGHSVLMKKKKNDFQQTDEVYRLFSRNRKEARREYRKFIKKGLDEGSREDLNGGGLIRSMGGWYEVEKMRRSKRRELSDERILGHGDFVEKVLKHVKEKKSSVKELKDRGWTPERVLERVSSLTNVPVSEIFNKHFKQKSQSRARAIACAWMVDELGMKCIDVGRLYGVTQPAVSFNCRKGREYISKDELVLCAKE